MVFSFFDSFICPFVFKVEKSAKIIYTFFWKKTIYMYKNAKSCVKSNSWTDEKIAPKKV